MKITPEGKTTPQNYICVEKDEAFQISIKNINADDKDNYGAILFLNGQVTPSIKSY
jgi:hypothetical protein